MRHQLVTLFDFSYASRALTLLRSLERFGVDYRLWAICVDQAAADLLREIGAENVEVLAPDDWETDQMKVLRSTRTREEYCWSLTPFSFEIVFSRQVESDFVVYVDADLWFARDPTALLNAIRRDNLGAYITEHAFSQRSSHLEKFGRFNVQFLAMNRTAGSAILGEWQRQCFEWCFAREEDGKFGDQKYLDDWPAKFGSLVEIGTPSSAFQGPWNAERFSFDLAVTYHFSSFRLLHGKLVKLAGGGYVLPPAHVENLYIPYIKEIRQVEKLIHDLGFGVSPITQRRGSVAKWAHQTVRNVLRGESRRENGREHNILKV